MWKSNYKILNTMEWDEVIDVLSGFDGDRDELEEAVIDFFRGWSSDMTLKYKSTLRRLVPITKHMTDEQIKDFRDDVIFCLHTFHSERQLDDDPFDLILYGTFCTNQMWLDFLKRMRRINIDGVTRDWRPKINLG